MLYYSKIDIKCFQKLLLYSIMYKLLTGPMKAGKTRRLALEIEKCVLAKRKVLLVTPRMDTRNTSHNHFVATQLDELKTNPLVDVASVSSIESLLGQDLKKYHAIFVDEFFMITGWSKEWFFSFKKQFPDTHLTLAGITNGFGCDTFKAVSIVLPFMDKIEKELAICEKCGQPANYFMFRGGVKAWTQKEGCIDNGCTGFDSLCLGCYIKACDGIPVYPEMRES